MSGNTKELRNTDSVNSNKFGIPADELAELTEIFNLVDIDHGGSIDGDEVKQLMQTLGIQTTEVRIQWIQFKFKKKNMKL